MAGLGNVAPFDRFRALEVVVGRAEEVLGRRSAAWATWTMAVDARPRPATGDETAGIALGPGASPADVLGAWYARARGRLPYSFSEWFDPAAVALVEAAMGRGALRAAVETYAAARKRHGFTNDDLLVDLTSLVAALPEGTLGAQETLATRAGLERALSRIYRSVAADGEPPSRTHALVVVDVTDGPGRLLTQVAERMRADLPVDGPVAMPAPQRVVATVDRRVGLARSLAALRTGLHLDPVLSGFGVRVRVQRLPLTMAALVEVLDGLSAPVVPGVRRPAVALRGLAATLAGLLVVAGVATLELTGGRGQSVLQVAGRPGPVTEVSAAPQITSGDEVAAPARPAPQAVDVDAGRGGGGQRRVTPVAVVPVASVRPVTGGSRGGGPKVEVGPAPTPAPVTDEHGPPGAPSDEPGRETPPTPPPEPAAEDPAPGRSGDAPGKDKGKGGQSAPGKGKSAPAASVPSAG